MLMVLYLLSRTSKNMILTKFPFLCHHSTLQSLTFSGASDSHFRSSFQPHCRLYGLKMFCNGVNCNGMFSYRTLQNSSSEYKHYYRRQTHMHGQVGIIKIQDRKHGFKSNEHYKFGQGYL